MGAKESVLGNFIHRALALPFIKRQAVWTPELVEHGGVWVEAFWSDGKLRPIESDGKPDFKRIDVVDMCTASAQAISDAFAPAADRGEWSRAELIIDAGGPWWSKHRTDFLCLSPEDQRFVLDRIVPTTTVAAKCLGELTVRREWSFLWSEVPTVASWDAKGKPSENHTDLVTGNAEELVGIDWKTSANRLKGPEIRDAMSKLEKELRRLDPCRNVRRSARVITIMHADEEARVKVFEAEFERREWCEDEITVKVH